MPRRTKKNGRRPAIRAKGVGSASQLHGEIVAFLNQTHDSLVAAKKNAVAALERRGGDALEAARQRGAPLGEALEDAVSEYSNHLADEYSYVDPFGRVVNKTALIERLRSGEGIFEDFQRTQENIRVYDTRAVVTSLVRVRGEISGAEASGYYRETHTMEKEAEQWRLLATQLTRVQTLSSLVIKAVECDGVIAV